MGIDVKKYGVLICAAMLVLALCMSVQASADSEDGFRLDSSGLVTLDSSHAAKEGISSLCFSLTVEPEDADKVEFVFSESSAEILEYSYRAGEKKLNIYMAGTSPLFTAGTESLSVGRVVVKDGDGKDREATVGVAPDSLQFVYGSKLIKIEGVDIPEAVRIGSGQEPPATQTPPPTAPPATEVPAETPGFSGNGGQGTGSGGPEGGGSSQSQDGQGLPLTVGSQGAGGNTAKPADRRPIDEKEPEPSGEDLYAVTPVPLDPDGEEHTPSPDAIEVAVLPAFGEEGKDGTEGQSGQAGAFVEEMKLLGTGFAIAAGVTGTGASAVAFALRPGLRPGRRLPHKRLGKRRKNRIRKKLP